MLDRIRKENKGFTIIEVMIVLAIAGLIILIVLLAVPALQRNGRNTAIKNDASSIVSGISEFRSTNDGAQPTGITKAAGSSTVNYTGTSGMSATAGKIQADTTLNVATTVPTEPGVLNVALKRKCNAAGTNIESTVSNRSIAVLYLVETSGTSAPKCTDA